MRYQSVLALAFLCLGLSSQAAGEASVNAPPEILSDLDELSASLAKVEHAFQDVCAAQYGFPSMKDWDQAAKKTGYFPGGCGMFVQGEEPKASPLFTEPSTSLSAWVAAIQSGQDSYPPLPEIRAAMSNWRVRVETLLKTLRQEQSLELELAMLEKQEKTLKADSPESVTVRRRISDLREELIDARQELDSHFSIPLPYTSADRTASPFDGPVTPGVPDRLWIWLGRRSAIINQSIDAQIGLGNKDGPNVIANKDYPVTLNCSGCVFNNSNILIPRGSRVAHSSVKVTSPKAILTAQSPGVRRADSQPIGCHISERLRIRPYQSQSQGPAGIPIPFQILFVDEHNDPATDGLNRKHFSLQLDGQGSVCPDPHAGALSSDGAVGSCPDLPDQTRIGITASNTLPADQCEADLVIDSRMVGSSVVSVQSLDQQSESRLTFQFRYPWPRTDLYMLSLGAIAGFFSNYFIRRKRKLQWHWSLASSILGAFMLFAIGVWRFLDRVSVFPTWPFALLWELFGGILGVSAAKFVRKLIIPHGGNRPGPGLPSNGHGTQVSSQDPVATEITAPSPEQQLGK